MTAPTLAREQFVSFAPHSAEEVSEKQLRVQIDESVTSPVVLYFVTGIFWLVLGSLAGLVAAVKFNLPDWLGGTPFLTFGRIRPVHLNAVMYGWASLAGAGMIVWLTGRLCRVAVRETWSLYVSVVLWNVGVLFGVVSLVFGYNQGMEWLEFPKPAGGLIALGFLFFAYSMIQTFRKRQVEHLYVSLWYILASLLWFPILYVVANLGIYSGVTEAAMNWWFGHNALAVWFTPVGLAGAYYFIPKVIGRPIYSYYLGLLGFWAFALFYNWNGIHHLVGGPLPTWLVTV